MKKIFLLSSLILLVCSANLAFAQDASNTIPLPPGFVDGMMTIAVSQLSQWAPLVYTILGILLAVIVIELLLHSFRPK